MSGVLPTPPLPPPPPPPPAYGSAGVPFRSGRPMGSVTGMRRAPLDRGIRRTTECPCAVRLYHMPGHDITARSEYCSVVLGAPSVGIRQALAPAAAGPSPASAGAAGAVERPVAVQLTWADTTAWEVARTALQAVRPEIDAAFAVARREARLKSAGSGAAAAATAGAEQQHHHHRNEETAGGGEGKGEQEEAPYSTPLPRYRVELLTGTVSPEGRASVLPLCMVSCRQVVHGHPALMPVRRRDWADYNTALYELTYNLGDPVFVTCTRTQ